MDCSLPGSSVCGFSRQESWSGLPCTPLEDLPESESEVTESCLILCDPIDCSLPGSSVHEIFQTIVLEWVAISFSRGSLQPRDRSQVSCLAGGFFYHELSAKPNQKGVGTSAHNKNQRQSLGNIPAPWKQKALGSSSTASA